jgi:fatty acid desaturase
MPDRRALVTAALPGLLTFLVFWLWLGISFAAAVVVGLAWGVATLIVTRLLYEDPETDAAAWRQEAPDLAGPVQPEDVRS